MDKWKQQKRDSKGRWLSYDGTRNRKYSLDDIKNAFLDGIEYAKFERMTLQKKLEIYLKSKLFE